MLLNLILMQTRFETCTNKKKAVLSHCESKISHISAILTSPARICMHALLFVGRHCCNMYCLTALIMFIPQSHQQPDFTAKR